jgi:hypothetical protein
MRNFMKNLYCFILDKNTGKITKYTVEEYRLKKHPVAKDKDEYIFMASMGKNTVHPLSVRVANLDRVMNDRMYTFDGNEQKAIKTFLDDTMRRRDEAYQNYDTAQILLERLHNQYVKNNEVGA